MRVALLVVLFFPFALEGAEKPAVVELFEDDADTLIPQLINSGGDGQEAVAQADEKDFFTGSRSLRVTPMQRYHDHSRPWRQPLQTCRQIDPLAEHRLPEVADLVEALAHR